MKAVDAYLRTKMVECTLFEPKLATVMKMIEGRVKNAEYSLVLPTFLVNDYIVEQLECLGYKLELESVPITGLDNKVEIRNIVSWDWEVNV